MSDEEIAERIANKLLESEVEFRKIRDSITGYGMSEERREQIWPTKSPTPGLLKALEMKRKLTEEGRY